MSSATNQPDDNLVSKYLAGEASPAEAMLVHEWISDPENRKTFDQMLKAWNMIPGALEMQLPETGDSWSHIEDVITTPQKKTALRRWIPYTVAAAVAGIALFITFNRNSNNDTQQPLQPQTTSYTITKSAGNVILTHNMPDGSTININKGGAIAYSASFNKADRNVQLTGEAFFSVAPDPSKPFIIEIEELKIKVTGTAFNVRKLHGEEKIEVQVESGVVEMYTAQDKITVRKMQTGIFDRKQSTLVLQEGLDINSISYATKTFSFNDLTLKEASRYLENAFDVSIQIDEAKFSDCRITAAFENKSLTYILDVMNATLNTSYRQDGDTITIEGEGCK